MIKHTALLAGTVAVAVLATSATALGDAKYQRASKIEIKVKQTDATKKREVKPEKKEDRPPPELSADRFFVIEGAVQDIQDSAIETLKELIREVDDTDPAKADLLFRLAEQYAGKQRYARNTALEALIKADQSKNPADKSKWQRANQQAAGQEKKWLIEAVKVYKAIAENPKFKGYARIDEALFFYAYTLQQAKYEDEARVVFKRLIKDYPASKFIPNAYLSFAEFYFKDNQLEPAEKFYDKVLEFPKASVWIYALYMKGWVIYNMARPEDSMRIWYEVAQKTAGNKKDATLNRASKKDFVRAYADVGKAESALQAFKRVDEAYSFKMLSFLGDYYMSQGKWEKAIYIYRQMIDLEPKDKQVCEWEVTIVRAMMSVGTPEQKVKELERLAKLYTFLKGGKAIPAPALQECRDESAQTTGELAKIWHQEGLKTLNFDTLSYVHRLYKLYQDTFPDAEDSAEMQFYYAELLWSRAEAEKNPSKGAQLWEEAAYEYNKFIEMGPKDPKQLKDAAYAMVYAWRNALAADPTADRGNSGDGGGRKDTTPQPIPEKDQKMLAAFVTYQKYITDAKDDDRTAIKFLEARTYWKHNHFDKAIPLFQDVIKNRPDHETAEFSANLLLDSLATQGQDQELLRTANALMANTRLLEDRGDLKDRLATLKAQGMRRVAEAHEKEGRFRECGDTYREIANAYPTADDLDQVYYNAAVCFEKAKFIGQAVAFRKLLTEKFPTKPLAQKAKFALGLNYAAIAYYDQAAQQFEEYAKKFGGEKNASDAMSNAVFFRRGLGQDEKAIENTNAFVKAYSGKDAAEAASAFYSMGDIYEKRKDFDQLVKHYKEYLKRFAKKGGLDKEMAAHVKIGEVLWRNACPVKGVNGACIEIKREKAIKMTRKEIKKRGTSQKQCGETSKNKVVLHDRKANLVREAQGHFQAAIKLWDNGGEKGVSGKDEDEKKLKTALAIYWVAAANFYLAEDKFEKVLSIKFPEKLDFSPTNQKRNKDSIKRFGKWKEDKDKAMVSGEKQYMHVVNDIKGGGAHWAIASAARVGQLYQNYSGALFTAEIPAVPADLAAAGVAQDFVDAYCDALTDAATPLEEKSIQGFSFCLETSTGLNWYNEWSRLCEGELAQIRPQDFPTAGELRADPTSTPAMLDVQPIVSKLDVRK